MLETDVETHLKNGREFFEQGNFDKAIEEFLKVYKIDPNTNGLKNGLAVVYFNRGLSHHQNGDLDKAIADISESIQYNPNDAHSYGARGFLLGKKKDYDGVIRDFTEVIRIMPTAMDYSSRGDGYYYKSRKIYQDQNENKELDSVNYFKYFDLAIKDFEEAVKLDPSNELFQGQLKNAIEERKLREGIEDYQKTLRSTFSS